MSLIDEVRQRRRLPKPSTARAIREEAGISQQRMATEIGVDRMTLARWESGRRKPRPRAAASSAALLDQLRQVSP